jgi:CBS domain-containing protein
VSAWPRDQEGRSVRETLSSFLRPVAVAALGETVATAARRMRDRRVGCLVVRRGDRPIGILTDRDGDALADASDPADSR